MPFLFLLASPAHAEPVDVDACEAYVAASFPRAGDVDVPVDAVPTLVVDHIRCDPLEWLVELEDDAAGVVVVQSALTTGIGVLELPMPGPLGANTAYTLRVSDPSGVAEVVEIGFTTSGTTAAASPWAPALSDVVATWTKPAGPLDVAVTAALPDDGGAPGLVMLGHTGPTADGEPEGRVGGLLDEEGAPYTWSVSLDEAPDTWCAWGRGRGESASWFPAAEPVCVSVEEVLLEPAGATCAGYAAHAGALPGALIPACLLAAAARRRRG